MKAVVIIEEYDLLTAELKKYFQEDNMTITKGKGYTIFALSNWKNVFFYLIISDENCPEWIPSNVFNLIDGSIPNDWIINHISETLKMILGPEYIARSEEAYNSMVQLESNSIKMFWDKCPRPN